MNRVGAARNSIPGVKVTIDRLALGGLDPAARAAFVQGLRSGLARILADPATLALLAGNSASRQTPVLRLGRVALQPGAAGARVLGGAVARAIGKSGAIAGKGSRP